MRLIRQPLSLALRLTLLFGIMAAIIFSVFGWIISQSSESHFAAEDTNELEIIAHAVQDVLSGIRTVDDITPLQQRFDDILVGHHHASLYIADKDGQTIYASPGPDLVPIKQAIHGELEGSVLRQWRDADHTYRVLIQHVHEVELSADGPYTLVVAVPIDVHLRFLAAFRRSLWVMIAGCAALVSLLGWVVVRRGHTPLHDIVDRIRSISTNELNTRLPPEDVPQELTDLVNSFNGLLERVDTAFHRLSNFSADIAHELRTPITSLMTQTQVALSRTRTVDEYREILYSNMEEYERMAQMVGDMLFLAQTDNRPQIENIEEVNLADEAQALFDFYEGWAEERGIVLALEGVAVARGDRLMLRRALGNLLSNAIRHTPAGGTVQVNLNTSNDDIGIDVENPGPEIPTEHLPKLFERFYRVDSSRQRGGDGAGLGLAIVKSIVTAHGGKIEVVSADGCTRFRITLPRRPAPRGKHTRSA